MEIKKMSDLKAHPRNEEFFDNIHGEDWFAFVDSIKTRLSEGHAGLIHPIAITDDNVIVSGHQRYRAYQYIGLDEIEVEIKHYDSEDDILKDMIEANLRQRNGAISNQVKFGKCVLELERIYGIGHGNNQRTSQNGKSSKTQQKLQNEMGVSNSKYHRGKQLPSLPKEYQQMIMDGNITPSAAVSILTQMSPEELEELLPNIPAIKKYTQKELQNIIDDMQLQLQQKNDQIDVLELEKKELLESDAAYTKLAEDLQKVEAESRKNYEKWQSQMKATDDAKKKADANAMKLGIVKDYSKTLNVLVDTVAKHLKNVYDIIDYMKPEDKELFKEQFGKLEDMAIAATDRLNKKAGDGKIVAMK